MKLPPRAELLQYMENVAATAADLSRGELTDDARYRLVVSGNILGIDFNKQFIG
ncbi:MAG: hypothetical protein IH805_00360 [Proteobacteria bacterium]|nr:hypothetical protein [Pseudomonadota bacterium]